MANIKVSIVEDSDLIRESFKMLLDMTDGIQHHSSFSNAEDAVSEMPFSPPDVVLMDIELPGMNGVEAVKILNEKCPETQFIISTVFDDDENIFEALKSGAKGYILKKSNPAKIIESIIDIYSGGAPMSSQIARKVMQFVQFGVSTPKTNIDHNLTDREFEILKKLSQGFRYKEIADQCHISLATVRTHIHKIYDKLHVSSRTDAINKVFS